LVYKAFVFARTERAFFQREVKISPLLLEEWNNPSAHIERILKVIENKTL